jgi:hypothetical protein
MRRASTIVALVVSGCAGGGSGDETTDSSLTQSSNTPGFITSSTEVPGTASDPTTTQGPTSDPTTVDPPTTGVTDTIDPPSTSSTTGGGCGACDEPNQQCVDGECVTGCQGQDPDPCGPAQVCDVISGTCVDADAACALAGPSVDCGDKQCGPGTACDDQGTCLAVAPCALEVCTSGGACWGGACQCDRGVTCQDPAVDLLNGPFSADISGLDFADDCTAWAVTVSGGQEFVRRLNSAGELTTWGAIGDFDLGEVRVLRHLTVPQLTVPPDGVVTNAPTDPVRVEGYGEVALTYICCPTCGDCANNPNARGVARLVEEDPNMPLPIVIFAEPTQGTGPFGNMAVDGGPQGLTWGEDRVLYVGNTKANGQFDTADLEAATVSPVFLFPDRTTAAAAISPVHLIVAVHPGQLHRLNTITLQTEFVVDLMSGVTSLSHDAFNGDVYAGLASLEVVRVRPFTGEVEDFAIMPAKGRVAVSPSGNLWFTPVKYLNPAPLSPWPLPTSL